MRSAIALACIALCCAAPVREGAREPAVIAAPCLQPWPSDRDDALVGFYVAERGAMGSTDILVVDRESITILWRNLGSLRGCNFNHGDEESVFPGVRRFERRIEGTRVIARIPCTGFREIGVLEGDAIVNDHGERYIRAQPVEVASCVRDAWLACQPVFRGQPIPLTARDLEVLALSNRHFRGIDPASLARPPQRCTLEREAGPHSGVYHRPPDRNVVIDARWIVMDWDPAVLSGAACSYGARDDLPRGMHRFASRIVNDVLEARVPCEGWRTIGRFAGEDLTLDGEPAQLGAVPYCAEDDLFACRPIYEAP